MRHNNPKHSSSKPYGGPQPVDDFLPFAPVLPTESLPPKMGVQEALAGLQQLEKPAAAGGTRVALPTLANPCRDRNNHLPEWIFGESPDRRHEYLVHTVSPRFIARLATGKQLGSGLFSTIAAREQIVNFVWIDAMPEEVEFRRLMSSAEDALHLYLCNK